MVDLLSGLVLDRHVERARGVLGQLDEIRQLASGALFALLGVNDVERNLKWGLLQALSIIEGPVDVDYSCLQ